MNETLYDRVEALAPGTIFNISGGVPWQRTDRGVRALIMYYEPAERGNLHGSGSIPKQWDGMDGMDYQITVLHGEGWA